MNPKRLFLLLALTVIPITLLFAQTLRDSIHVKVDQLFQRWDRKDAPGCVAGIIIGDSLVYKKGFGLAQLEQGIPATPESIYYMCSVSKQFAGYAVAYLVHEGKIGLDDDMHVYLPRMKDFGHKITVRHLLHHTSGLRDDIRLMDLFGLNGDGLLTQQLAVNLLEQQHSLNFAPGEQYAYSNSNYVLLAEIVEKASGTSFRAFTDSIIFRPLKMKASFFADNPYALMPGLAPSYRSSNGQWSNARQQVYTLGDGGLFTSLDDMARWVGHIGSADARTRAIVEIMTATTPLNDGRRNTYAMGIDVDTVKGYRRLLHNGSLAGYRTEVLMYPSLRLGFVVFGNGGDNGVYGKVQEMAALFMPPLAGDRPGLAVKADSTVAVTQVPDSNGMKKLSGQYIAADGFRADMKYERGHLWVGPNELVPAGGTAFHLKNRPAVRFRFVGEQLELTSPGASKPIVLQRAGQAPAAAQLTAYAGTYYSDELDCRFTIVRNNDKLEIRHTRLGSTDLSLIGRDHGVTRTDFIRHILFKRDQQGRIVGFDYNDGAIMHLHFRKENYLRK